MTEIELEMLKVMQDTERRMSEMTERLYEEKGREYFQIKAIEVLRAMREYIHTMEKEQRQKDHIT